MMLLACLKLLVLKGLGGLGVWAFGKANVSHIGFSGVIFGTTHCPMPHH
jgi:hypothetical protein